jgi:hypothetical protein
MAENTSTKIVRTIQVQYLNVDTFLRAEIK